MLNLLRMRCLCCAVALCALVDVASGAEIDPPHDVHGLEEVRHISKLPPGLAKTLGWQGTENDRIGDLEREPGNSNPTWIDRWFILGGLSKAYALIAVENRVGYPSFDRFHVNSFTLVGSDWVASGEWVLSSRPHTIDELAHLLGTPESEAITAQWRKWKHRSELDQRMFGHTANPYYRANATLRKINISDEEVREIQAVVHEVAPGAIVLISGVVQDCPCEDGPACSAQVWTAIDRSEGIRSLELSDINGHWIIGPVQRWLLESAKIERTKFPTFAKYAAALGALNERYPTCGAGPSNTH